MDGGRDGLGSPVSDGEAHRVADEDDGHDGFAAQLLVRIDAVADGQLGADGVDEAEETEGEDETEPVDVMRGSDAPQDQAPGNEGQQGNQEPETVFGLHDALVASRQLENEPVSCTACI